jgi:hypothetical protein
MSHRKQVEARRRRGHGVITDWESKQTGRGDFLFRNLKVGSRDDLSSTDCVCHFAPQADAL